MSSKCPLCGENKPEGNLFCPDCTVKLDSEYELNAPTSKNSEADAVENTGDNTDENTVESTGESTAENEIEASEQNIEEKEPTEEEPIVIVPPSKLDEKAWKKQKEDKRTDSERSYYEITRDKNTNKITYTIILVSILVLTLIAALFAYNNHVKSDNLERSRWEAAQRENTVDSYLTYMDEYPQGTFGDEAYDHMISLKNDESVAWENLTVSENTLEFSDFLERYPESPYGRKVKNRLDSLVWESTMKENSAESYSDYIDRSTSREIMGDYIGEAQKRLKMLEQSTPVDEADMEQLREAVNGFFAGLSNMSHTELSEYLAPVLVRFNNSTQVPRDKMIGELMLLASKADAKSLRYDPEITKLKYEKMGNDTYWVNVPIQKIFEGNNGGTNQIKGYIVHLKLDFSFKIFSFHETKPFTTAP